MKKRVSIALIALLVMLLAAGCTRGKGNGFAEATPTSSLTPKTGKDLYHECGGQVILASYDKLKKVGDEAIEVTDEELEAAYQEEIEYLLAYYPNYVRDESRDGSVIASGDTVNIDYVGVLDGVAFEGGTDTDYDLTIGSHSFIEDFENGLIGKTVGTTVDIDTKFPDEYSMNPDLAGKTTTFTVTINYIGKEVEGADDTYINRLTDGMYPTLEALKDAIREDLIAQKQDEIDSNKYDSVISDMVDNSEFVTILDEDVAFYEEDLVASYTSYAQMYGYTLEDFLPLAGYDSYDVFMKDLHESAISYVKEYMVLQEVYKQAGLTLSDEEFESRLAGYMASAQETDREAFIELYSKEYLEYCMKNDLALDYLVEKSKEN